MYEINDFHLAMGQYDNYRLAIIELQQNRTVYLAITEDTWNGFFQKYFIQKIVQTKEIRFIIFQPDSEIIIQWIH